MPLRMIPYEKPAEAKARRTRRPKGLDFCAPDPRALPRVEFTGFSAIHHHVRDSSISVEISSFDQGRSSLGVATRVSNSTSILFSFRTSDGIHRQELDRGPLVKDHSNMLLFTPLCVGTAAGDLFHRAPSCSIANFAELHNIPRTLRNPRPPIPRS